MKAEILYLLLLILDSFSILKCKKLYYSEIHKKRICNDECQSYSDSRRNWRACKQECLQRQQNYPDYEIGGLQALVVPTLKVRGTYNVMVVWDMVYPIPDNFTVAVKEDCSTSSVPVISTASGQAESSKYLQSLKLSQNFEVTVIAKWGGDIGKSSSVSECLPGPRGESEESGRLALEILLGLLGIGCSLAMGCRIVSKYRTIARNHPIREHRD